MLQEFIEAGEFKSISRRVLRLLEQSYFRVEVEGLENLPKSGRALICPNHSGYLGSDAVLLTDLIKKHTRRRARIMAHRAFFDFSTKVRGIAESMGLKRAGVDAGVEILRQNHLLLLFPEGEAGNFKSSVDRYELQEFKTGFLRMAIQAKAPIIPCIIIGAEESHLNFGNLNLSKYVKGLRIPMPLNLIPLPAKWKIKFFPAIDLSGVPAKVAGSKRELKKIARRVHDEMQAAIEAELRGRTFIFFPKTREIYDSLPKPRWVEKAVVPRPARGRRRRNGGNAA